MPLVSSVPLPTQPLKDWGLLKKTEEWELNILWWGWCCRIGFIYSRELCSWHQTSDLDRCTPPITAVLKKKKRINYSKWEFSPLGLKWWIRREELIPRIYSRMREKEELGYQWLCFSFLTQSIINSTPPSLRLHKESMKSALLCY